MKNLLGILAIVLLVTLGVLVYTINTTKTNNPAITNNYTTRNVDNAQAAQLISDARSQIGITTHYDGDYKAIPYPQGDVTRYWRMYGRRD